MIRLEPKRSNEVRDYLHDWTPFLVDDTIQSQTTIGTGITINGSSIETGNQAIKFWVSGGTIGTVGTITQTIVTAGGRTETETFTLAITAFDEPVTLAEAKDYLRVRHSDEDAKIAAMIPSARLWVEDHTGIALTQRTIIERVSPGPFGLIRLAKEPVVSIASVDYIDSLGAAQTYVPRHYPPSSILYPVSGESWPTLADDEEFVVEYTAGHATPEEIDDRLLGAMKALIEGEFSEGYAYPERAIKAAEGALAYLRQMVA